MIKNVQNPKAYLSQQQQQQQQHDAKRRMERDIITILLCWVVHFPTFTYIKLQSSIIFGTTQRF